MEGELSVVEAADYVGVSERGLRDTLKKGELRSLTLADVRALHQARQVDALHDLERSRQDPVALAHEVRERLHPRHLPKTGLPGEAEGRTQFRLSVLPQTARVLFGLAALNAACSEDGSKCRWCLARDYAGMPDRRGLWAPTEWSSAFAVLLGDPCAECWPGLRAPVMAAMRADVHAGRTRPSAPAPRPSAEETRLAAEWALQRAPVAAAKPVGGDGGRALVSRRRRQVQAQLTAAKRRGDQRHAIQLRAMLQSLTADASAVDGRAAAARKPGVLKCGHALSATCACPRRASR